MQPSPTPKDAPDLIGCYKELLYVFERWPKEQHRRINKHTWNHGALAQGESKKGEMNFLVDKI